MEKFSVKKPFTVLVMVIIVVVLGVVSVTRLPMDLLPSISLPYLVVVTTYPGASPEKVESTVGEPMESALGTISGVKNVYSTNAENYNMTQLEFEDGTDMDSAMVKVSSALEQATASLPEGAGTPSMIEMSMDMMATMYVAVSHDDYDIYELTDFIDRDVTPYMERQDGVANVTNVGSVVQSVQVELDQEKIDRLNDRILAETNRQLADARKKLDDAQAQVDEGKAQLQEREKTFGDTVSSAVFDQLTKAVPGMTSSLKAEVQKLIAAATGLQEKVQSLDQAAAAAQAEAEAETQKQLAAAERAGQQLRSAAESAKNTAKEAGDSIKKAADDAADEIKNAADSAKKADDAEQTSSDSAEGGENEDSSAAGETAGTEAEDAAGTEDAAGSAKSAVQSAVQGSGIPENIQQELRTLIAQLRSAAESGAASFSDLMSLAVKISSLTSRVQSLIQDVEAMQPADKLNSGIEEVKTGLTDVNDVIDEIPGLLDKLEEGYSSLTQAQLDAAVGFSTASVQLTDAQTNLDTAMSQYESSRDQALKGANADSLLSASTLSQLIYAQNFSMPAGYIDDQNDNSWLLKVGDEYDSADQISEALLVDLDGIGTVRLSDVAEVTIVDNSEESYAKLNGEDGVVLCIYKSSTAGTNEVSRTAKTALSDLEKQNDGMKVVTLMDQGVYITMIIDNILSSMIVGAILAIVVLALFLKDIRPTLVVGISIPLSVLFTLVLMYFTGLSLNIMTLSGLALGVGMLVDNSIVVMENIFRLRSSGIQPARAAVQGARQVRGAIIASTLTTVCVFLPMVFTTGTVRQLLVPMALAIGFCLMASLLMSLTVVPASASTIMKKVRPKEHRTFDRVMEYYGRSLGWCLRHKAVPLGMAILLLALTVWQAFRSGIVLFPEMTSNEIQVTIETPEEDTRETSYKKADQVADAILSVDGVENVGVMDESSTSGLVSAAAENTEEYGTYLCYVTAPEDAGRGKIRKIIKDIRNATKNMDCTVTATAGGMSDISSLTGENDLTIQIYGDDLDQLESISEEVMNLTKSVKGFTKISNGIEEGDKTIHLLIDKNKAMSYGLTVAQIYSEISARLTTDVQSTTVTIDGVEMNVSIKDETDPLTKENLMDMEFTSSASSEMAGSASTGMSAGTGGMSSGLSSGAAAGSSETGAASALSSGTEGDSAETETHRLSEFASAEEDTTLSTISRENATRYMTVTASTKNGYNTTLLTRRLQSKLESYRSELPDGYSVEFAGQTVTINDMMGQMIEMLLLGLLLIYMVMVAQFQSLLSPFIVLFTVPLAFTGGMLSLMISGQQLSMLAMMGFLILMGTVVNNGIVFVDYANQLRTGGLERREALIATGKTRMRPILMTALTTILAMVQLIFGDGMGSQLGSGMATVIAGGLAYATLMTLYIVPVMYDIFFKRKPLRVDIGDDIDDAPDDAAQYLEERKRQEQDKRH